MDARSLALIYLISLAPTLEGRYAVLVGLAMGVNPLLSLAAASLGVATISIALPLALSWADRLLTAWARRGGPLGRLGRLYLRIVERTRTKARPLVEKYGLPGLIIFVAAPLPGTGIWTGSLAALLLGLDRARTMIALLTGGLLSIAITFTPAYLGTSLWNPA